ncbi:MAG: maleylpyruvate isomerase family mycothiol-dependent enzyme, partial [Actinomycetota bacterium]
MEISAHTYLEHLKRDGERITQIAPGHMDVPVPSCPGVNVDGLLVHTAGVGMYWSECLVQNTGEPDIDWTVFPTDPLEAHTKIHARLVDEIGSRDPDQPTITWAGPTTVRFAYRRMAQEFAVHRWDFENALGTPLPIDPTLAADGVREFIEVFGPATGSEAEPGGSVLFAGDGEIFGLEATDIPWSLTFVARPDRFEQIDNAQSDVTARGTASDLLLFMWGRVKPDALDVGGD